MLGTVERFKVKIRRNLGLEVKPEAEKIDGCTFMFYYGWTMDNQDTYPEEIAWIPRDKNYPVDAPAWIASGDLQTVPDYIKELESKYKETQDLLKKHKEVLKVLAGVDFGATWNDQAEQAAIKARELIKD